MGARRNYTLLCGGPLSSVTRSFYFEASGVIILALYVSRSGYKAWAL